MKVKTTRSLLAMFASALLLSGFCACSRPTPTPAATVPSPGSTPAEATPTLLPRDAAPKADLGIVSGTLTQNGQPAGGHMMYLAGVIHSSEGFDVAALDAVNDPRIESDASGYFAFLDVKPGTYALGILSPVGPVLFQRDGAEIVIEVQAGQILDLGPIKIVPFVQ